MNEIRGNQGNGDNKRRAVRAAQGVMAAVTAVLATRVVTNRVQHAVHQPLATVAPLLLAAAAPEHELPRAVHLLPHRLEAPLGAGITSGTVVWRDVTGHAVRGVCQRGALDTADSLDF